MIPKTCLFVSSNISNSEAGGHWYWYYRELRNFDGGHKINLQIRVLGQTHTDFSDADSLSRLGKYCEFNLVGIDAARDAKHCINEVFSRRATAIYFYEGSLRSLLVANLVKLSGVKARIFFNFFFGEQWAKLLVSRNVILNGFVKHLIKNLSDGAVLTAETESLQKVLRDELGVETNLHDTFSLLSAEARSLEHEERKLVFSVARDIPELGFISRLVASSDLQSYGVSELHIQVLNFLPSTEDLDLLERSAKGLKLVFHYGSLRSDEYAELLRSSKFTILPNLSTWYSQSSSARALDALACGSVPVMSQYLGSAKLRNGIVIASSGTEGLQKMVRTAYSAIATLDVPTISNFCTRLEAQALSYVPTSLPKPKILEGLLLVIWGTVASISARRGSEAVLRFFSVGRTRLSDIAHRIRKVFAI